MFQESLRVIRFEFSMSYISNMKLLVILFLVIFAFVCWVPTQAQMGGFYGREGMGERFGGGYGSGNWNRGNMGGRMNSRGGTFGTDYPRRNYGGMLTDGRQMEGQM